MIKTKFIFLTQQVADHYIVIAKNAEGSPKRCIRCNEVGKIIFEAINEGKTENEIVANICQTFNVNPDEVEKDLCQFLKDMVDKQLIDIYQPEE